MEGYLVIVLTLGSLYGFLVVATCFTFRFFSFPDLTLDGSFVAGAAVSAITLQNGGSLLLAVILGFLAGSSGGLVTAMLHELAGINKLFSGILSSMVLFSVNLRLMGGANLSLLDVPGIFERMTSDISRSGLCLSLFISLTLMTGLLFHTKLGLYLRAIGSNPNALKISSVRRFWLTCFALCMSNGIAGLGGVFVSQFQGFVDINMGLGVAISSFAALFLGETIISLLRIKSGVIGKGLLASPAPVKGELLAVIAGALLFYSAITLVLFIGLPPADQKAFSALVLVAGMVFRRQAKSNLLSPQSKFEQ